MKKLLFIFILTNSFHLIYSQSKIIGIIKDTRGVTLTGISIIEKNTSNGTVSDIQGQFTLSCTIENPVLIFSFIGFKSKEIQVKNNQVLEVILDDDSVAFTECFYKIRYVTVGFQSGFNNTPYGFKVEGTIPPFFWENPILYVYFEWRTNSSNNEYLRTEANNYLFEIKNYKLSFEGNYTFAKRNKIEFKEYNLITGISNYKYYFSVGYTYQKIKTETQSFNQDGLWLGIKTNVLPQLYLDINTRIINNSLLFGTELSYYYKKFNIAFGYDHNQEFEVFDVSLTYQITY